MKFRSGHIFIGTVYVYAGRYIGLNKLTIAFTCSSGETNHHRMFLFHTFRPIQYTCIIKAQNSRIRNNFLNLISVTKSCICLQIWAKLFLYSS